MKKRSKRPKWDLPDGLVLDDPIKTMSGSGFLEVSQNTALGTFLKIIG